MAAARLQRYAVFLTGFNYDVIFRKGIDNTNVDCLSRAPINALSNDFISEEVNQICENTIFQISSETINFKTIQIETKKDEELAKIVENLKNSNSAKPEYALDIFN